MRIGQRPKNSMCFHWDTTGWTESTFFINSCNAWIIWIMDMCVFVCENVRKNASKLHAECKSIRRVLIATKLAHCLQSMIQNATPQWSGIIISMTMIGWLEKWTKRTVTTTCLFNRNVRTSTCASVLRILLLACTTEVINEFYYVHLIVRAHAIEYANRSPPSRIQCERARHSNNQMHRSTLRCVNKCWTV